MEKFLLSLGLIAFGLVLGQFLQTLVDRRVLKAKDSVDMNVKRAQNFALLVLNPAINLAAFWMLKVNNLKLIAMPFIGFSGIILGGIIAILMAKAFGMERKQTGAMFVSGSFINMGTFGGLICFVFFGEASYAFVSMYRLFEEFTYYSIGFPVAKLYGTGDENDKKINIVKLFRDPYILACLLGIMIGSSLNFFSIPRPDFFSTVNAILIPLSSVTLVTTVGYRMRFTAVNNYIRECIAISSIKFLIIPVVMTTVAYLIGLGEIEDGIVLKVILILSSMPTAFNALVPPQLYGLDIDLANSCWLFTTVALGIVLPTLFAVQRILF